VSALAKTAPALRNAEESRAESRANATASPPWTSAAKGKPRYVKLAQVEGHLDAECLGGEKVRGEVFHFRQRQTRHER
jgi:hypothetical protein